MSQQRTFRSWDDLVSRLEVTDEEKAQLTRWWRTGGGNIRINQHYADLSVNWDDGRNRHRVCVPNSTVEGPILNEWRHLGIPEHEWRQRFILDPPSRIVGYDSGTGDEMAIMQLSSSTGMLTTHIIDPENAERLYQEIQQHMLQPNLNDEERESSMSESSMAGEQHMIRFRHASDDELVCMDIERIIVVCDICKEDVALENTTVRVIGLDDVEVDTSVFRGYCDPCETRIEASHDEVYKAIVKSVMGSPKKEPKEARTQKPAKRRIILRK